MFKAKRKSTGEIHQILSVYTDSEINVTFFLIWENDDWRWRPASSFVPPNYEIKGDIECQN
jgi:hypothetical protein